MTHRSFFMPISVQYHRVRVQVLFEVDVAASSREEAVIVAEKLAQGIFSSRTEMQPYIVRPESVITKAIFATGDVPAP